MQTTNTGILELPFLPSRVKEILITVHGSTPLGTSAVISMFAQALEVLAKESQAHSAQALVDQGVSLLDYYLRTRGQYSTAIANAFAKCRKRLRHAQPSKIEEVRAILVEYSHDVERQRQQRLQALVNHSAKLLANAHRILLFDYSSTVMKVVAKRTQLDSNLELVILESRTSNGGMPYVKKALVLNCLVTFIPEAALGAIMPICDAVLVGVETIFWDGSFTNTIGTLTTAVVAHHFDIPLYPVSELIKLNPMAVSEVQNDQPQKKLSDLLCIESSLLKSNLLNTTYPPLETTPPELIKSYITEIGLLRPEHIMEFAESPGAPEHINFEESKK